MIKKTVKNILAYFRYGKLTPREDLFSELSYPITSDLQVQSRPVFITGCARSGTHMFAKLFELHENINATHLDTIGHSTGDSFYKYVKWYDLPVSLDGLLNSRKFLVGQSFRKGKRYLEANPVIALNLEDLCSGLNPQFVISIRNPKGVVRSLFLKGWYNDAYPAFEKIPGYHYTSDNPNHAFSRIRPSNKKEYERWLTLSRFGQCAWAWRVTYEQIFRQLSGINADNWKIIHLNIFDFHRYGNLCDFLEVDNRLDEEKFNKVIYSRPGSSSKKKVLDLTAKQKEEFNHEIKPIFDHPFVKDISKEDWFFKN